MHVPIKLLEETAAKCLYATQNDEEQWSYLFRTEGNEEFWYYTTDDLEDLEIQVADYGQDFFADFDNQRLAQISNSEDEPSPEELSKLRKTVARWQLEQGYDDASQGFIVPVSVGSGIAGYAVFDCGRIDSFNDPALVSAHYSMEEARKAARDLGEVVNIFD